MEEYNKSVDLEKKSSISEDSCKTVAVCSHCRHHQHNPTIEFHFADSKVYCLCPKCKNMNEMDFSKPLPSAYPRTRRM